VIGSVKGKVDLPDESTMAQLAPDTVKVEKLVKEFLAAQSLSILPQNSFGDAVAQFVDKDDKQAMELFVNESLAIQLKHLMSVNDINEEDFQAEMNDYKTQLEAMFASGQMKKKVCLSAFMIRANTDYQTAKAEVQACAGPLG
jgi:double-strand break repair protein MRE11